MIEHKNALYIDTPFCVQKCLFGCPFYRGIGTKARIAQWYNEMLDKLDILNPHLKNTQFHELYLGGGNSTTITGSQWAAIFSKLPLNNIKYLLAETDLRTLTRDHISVWNDNNFKYVSLGVQSLDGKLLTSTGRKISNDTIDKQINLLEGEFNGMVNIDLICGISSGSMDDNVNKTVREVYSIINRYPNISFIDVHVNHTLSMQDRIQIRRLLIPKLRKVTLNTEWYRYNHTLELDDTNLQFESEVGCNGSNYRIANPNTDPEWVMRMSGCMSNSESGWIFYNIYDESISNGRIGDYEKDNNKPFEIELYINTALESIEYKSYEYQLKHRNALGFTYY